MPKTGKTRIAQSLRDAAPQFLDVQDVARMLACSAAHIRLLTQQGFLPRYKLGRSVRYKASEVLAAVETCREVFE